MKTVLPQEIIINGKYKLVELIGRGRFGTIYRGINKRNGEPVAIKFEINSKENAYHTLKYETSVLNLLYLKGCRTIPPIYWYGAYKNNIALVMPYYEGGSLFQYIQNNIHHPIPNVIINNLMRQMLCIIENIHSLGVIHRDIKPHNFMFCSCSDTASAPSDKKYKLILIDFGLAGFSSVEEDKTSLSNNNIIGTPNYISYYVHQGTKPTLMDDLISIGYIYLHLLWRTLPWVLIPNGDDIDAAEEEDEEEEEKEDAAEEEEDEEEEKEDAAEEDAEDEEEEDAEDEEEEDAAEEDAEDEEEEDKKTDIFNKTNQSIMAVKEWSFLSKKINECSQNEKIYKYLNYCYNKNRSHENINYRGLIQLFV